MCVYTHIPNTRTQHPRTAQNQPPPRLPCRSGLLQPYKDRYPTVGYADLWALAAVVAVEGMGGPIVPYRAGRRDARSAADSVPHGRLPDGAQVRIL